MTLAIAHRGDPRRQVENTLAAITVAVEQAADVVEVDVRLTADGVPVLHHDPDLLRLWSLPGLVEELTLAQLRCRAPQVPTLAEALDRLAGTGVPLLLDVEEPATALAALREVRQAGRPDAGWFCGSAEALAAVRALDREITLMLTLDHRGDPPDHVLRAVAPTYLNPLFLLLTRGVVTRWHRRGWQVCAWTVDSSRVRRLLLGWGVDALVSNDVRGVVADVRAHDGDRREPSVAS